MRSVINGLLNDSQPYNADFTIGIFTRMQLHFTRPHRRCRIYDRALSAAEVQALYNMGQ